ncbi:hypothetical protein [Rhodoblastus sp.]|uniref:hypothetical protein n=1 Tax=Rhodoblastus sp. TaxID=1962975 RepID=UPI003F97AD4D
MTAAERQARFRAAHADGAPKVRDQRLLELMVVESAESVQFGMKMEDEAQTRRPNVQVKGKAFHGGGVVHIGIGFFQQAKIAAVPGTARPKRRLARQWAAESRT